MKKAVVFGASGFVGSYLLRELLDSPDYEEVIAVVRRELPLSHPKLRMWIGDYNSSSETREKFVCDEVFIALGSTTKRTPDKREYYQVDHDYPVLAARLAREGGAHSVFLVSSVGANAASKTFYIRTKGETERDILALNFEHTRIFRPSMIMGHRSENRPLERVVLKVWPLIDLFLVGNVDRYRGTSAEDIARAMKNSAKDAAGRSKIYYWREMRELLQC
ncbi:NAD-dependent epimerase/dehydratase family protein [Granulicella sp. WH15]|nr:NAD-dependent epimerase/dehydratase family protein [Granulicella sp. WH15]